MENLSFILEKLKGKKDSFNGDYFIPKMWNSFNFTNYSNDSVRYDEMKLNPYEFISDCIEKIIKNSSGKGSISSSTASDVSLESSVIYCLFPRMLTAWNHYDNNLCSGTFLKTICMLPYLKKMNVNLVYLLPIFKYSLSNRKGDTGSPYSIKNIYQLDENLHDNLLGDFNSEILETEFKAFVEACHLLGIKVMVDFVFRTVARDSDLIIEHPDWFYWINLECKNSFCAPKIEGIKAQTVVSEKLVPKIYSSRNVSDYLKQFTYSPKDIDQKKWLSLVDRYKTSGGNILELIEEEFKITTAPGFSDVINDSQPPWSDVTYLRFYYDNHEMAIPHLNNHQAPYTLFDIAKLSLFKWKQPNTSLWDYTVNVISFYQENYGIDGARIDMGHALPTELNKEIIRKAKKLNPNFLLWSEEFNSLNSKKAMEDGFHFMTGSLWFDYKNIEKPGFYKSVLGPLLKSSLPITGALESPDTPRAAYNYKSFDSLEFMTIINNFMPNVIPMLNNGMEIMEIQPMNLGLDNTEEGRYVLPKTDPMYGKLAFFDNYKLHWTNDASRIMPDFLEKAFDLRNRFSKIIDSKDNFVYFEKLERNKKLLLLCYRDKDSDKHIIIIGNKSSTERAVVDFQKLLGELANKKEFINIIFQNRDFADIDLRIDKKLSILPKEALVCIL